MLNELLDTYNVQIEYIRNSNDKNLLLNNYTIYVINLKNDIIRRNYIQFLFKRHKLNYILVIVDKFKYKNTTELIKYRIQDCKMGCILSHLWCIKHAINQLCNRFIIFEDDIIFHKYFNEELTKYLSNETDIPDLLMLGAIDFKIGQNTKNLQKGCIYYPNNNILGAHANMYTLDFAKSFFEYKVNCKKVLEFDFDYANFMRTFKIGVCFPNLIVCELSTTNINHKFSPTNINNFNSYKRSLHNEFTYLDYEYMIIDFIQFVLDKYTSKIIYININEAIIDFIKLNNKAHIDLEKWLLNGTYSLDDLLVIIKNIKYDKYIK